jgi:hypothetical protein
MDKPKHKLLKFVAKRKYWIEWHFAFDKYPSKERKDLDKLHEFLEKYIERYLDKYFDKCHKHEGPGVKGYHNIPKLIVDDVHGFFNDDPGGSKSIKDDDDQFLEYHKWEGNEWKVIDAKDYEEIVEKNMDPKTTTKQALYYNVYTKKWIKLFKHEWVEISGSQYVFSYRGWFEGRNNIRLSDVNAESKGTANPPPPPPPPTAYSD